MGILLRFSDTVLVTFLILNAKTKTLKGKESCNSRYEEDIGSKFMNLETKSSCY